MTIVLASGTFDTLHEGHFYFLREAKKYGDKLVVILTTDKRVISEKGRASKFNQQERLRNLSKENIADEIIVGREENIYETLNQIKPDVICLGYDQKMKEKDIELELKKRNLNAKIIRVNSFHPEKYKSSLLRKG